jgi:hypothetical protein
MAVLAEQDQILGTLLWRKLPESVLTLSKEGVTIQKLPAAGATIHFTPADQHPVKVQQLVALTGHEFSNVTEKWLVLVHLQEFNLDFDEADTRQGANGSV